MTASVSPEAKKKLRVYKMADAEYEAAQAAAELEGEALAEVVRRLLGQYAARIEKKHEKARATGKAGRARKAA